MKKNFLRKQKKSTVLISFPLFLQIRKFWQPLLIGTVREIVGGGGCLFASAQSQVVLEELFGRQRVVHENLRNHVGRDQTFPPVRLSHVKAVCIFFSKNLKFVESHLNVVEVKFFSLYLK